MSAPVSHRHPERGSTLVESAMVGVVFLLLLVAIVEFGRIGYAYNSVSFAAHRAARYAALRGSGSGHPASAADIEANAQACLAAFDNTRLTVTTTWTPDNHPGSTVQVRVSYGFRTVLLPISPDLLTLQTTCRQIVLQ